jgi:hypothetical protein
MPHLRAGDVSARGARAWAAALAAALLLLPPHPAGADVFILLTGDRITGKPVLRGKRTITVQTPFGQLVIPRSRIERIIRADGREELVNAPAIVAAPTPAPAPARAPAARPRLTLVVQGQTFFYGWDKKDATDVDPSLRLEARLDEEPLASWVDARTDPGAPGAILNTFSFAPEDVSAFARRGVELSPSEVKPGSAVLKIGLPLETARRRLRLSYQINEGDALHPEWRDLAQGAADVQLRANTPTIVQVKQDRGRMEFSGFSRRRMKNVETFHIELIPE